MIFLLMSYTIFVTSIVIATLTKGEIRVAMILFVIMIIPSILAFLIGYEYQIKETQSKHN